MTDICLRNAQVIGTTPCRTHTTYRKYAYLDVLYAIQGGNNLLFGLAIRNLNNSLLQLYPEMYASDLPWLSSLIVCMEKHTDKTLRLQGELPLELWVHMYV